MQCIPYNHFNITATNVAMSGMKGLLKMWLIIKTTIVEGSSKLSPADSFHNFKNCHQIHLSRKVWTQVYLFFIFSLFHCKGWPHLKDTRPECFCLKNFSFVDILWENNFIRFHQSSKFETNLHRKTCFRVSVYPATLNFEQIAKVQNKAGYLIKMPISSGIWV